MYDTVMQDLGVPIQGGANGVMANCGNSKDRPCNYFIGVIRMVRLGKIKKEKSENKRRVPTDMELELEHTQQGSSYEVSSELVDIEKVAVCSSLRSPKSKRTIESGAKTISLGHDSTLLASSHTVKNPTSPPSPQRPLLTHTSPTPTPPRSLYYHGTTQMAVHTQPTLCLGYSAKLTEAMALSHSLFCKRYKSSYETPSSSSSPAEGTESEDEVTDLKDEETASQQQAISVEDTTRDEPLGLGNRVARRRALEQAMDIVPSTFEVGQSSRSTPDQHLEIGGETPTQTHARLPHLDKTCEIMTPYTKEAVIAYEKFLESASKYHDQDVVVEAKDASRQEH
nr:myosin heavy chain-related protein [Tanacetum cinerariifolium]